MAGETVQLRRPTDNYSVERVATDLVDLNLGNRGGMIRLRGYSGDVVSTSGSTAGTATSSNGYPLNVQSPIGFHAAFVLSGTSETAAPTTANSAVLITDAGLASGNGKSIRLYDADGVDYAELTADADGGLVLGGSGTAAGAFTLPGGILVTGTGKRFLADFSNGTLSNRFTFQTSTANSATGVGIIPSGSGTSSGIYMTNSSNLAATGYLLLQSLTTDARTTAGHIGGAYVPQTWYVNGAEAMRLATDGSLTVGTQAASATAGQIRLPNNTGVFGLSTGSVNISLIGLNNANQVVVGTVGAPVSVVIGPAATTAVGFFGSGGSTRAGAYVQTYSTADRTLSAYTADNESAGYSGITNAAAGAVFAQLSDLNALRTAYENLRVFAEDVAAVVNAHTDDLQSYNLVG